ncbi:MAG: ATP-binding protein [Oscillochloris sp.]|nr:ATP-binding protein [Oscillochloris sp.]
MPEVGWPLLFIVLGLIGVAIMAASRPQLFFTREPDKSEEEGLAQQPGEVAALKPRRLWAHLLNAMPDEAPHLFIYGPSGSGKTVLAQHLIAGREGQIVVLDPKWQVGKWGGAPAYSVDDEGSYAPIDVAAGQLLAEFRRRLRLHKHGQTDAPLTVVIDELPDLNDECPQVRKLFLALLRMGRELQMRLVALSTGRGVEDLGLKGRGDARRSLVTLRLGAAAIELRPELAKLARPAVLELRGKAIPLDLGEVRPTISPLPRERAWQPAPEIPAPTAVALPPAETLAPALETAGKALESAETASGEGVSEVEKVMIRGAVQAGKGKTETLQALKGYSGRRHREYSTVWEAARVERVGQGELA